MWNVFKCTLSFIFSHKQLLSTIWRQVGREEGADIPESVDPTSSTSRFSLSLDFLPICFPSVRLFSACDVLWHRKMVGNLNENANAKKLRQLFLTQSYIYSLWCNSISMNFYSSSSCALAWDSRSRPSGWMGLRGRYQSAPRACFHLFLVYCVMLCAILCRIWCSFSISILFRAWYELLS